MSDIEIVDLTPENIGDYGVCGYNDINKHLELRRKIEWFREYYPKGLRARVLQWLILFYCISSYLVDDVAWAIIREQYP